MKSDLRWLLVTEPLLLFFWLAAPAQAQVVCPDPPNRVTVQVNSTVTFDSGTGLYTYRYEVFNDPTSLQDIDDFGLDFAPPISDVISPQGWVDIFFDNRSTIRWYPFEIDPAATVEPGDIPPALFPIKPGTLMSGFSFKSPNPPGQVNFYVTGFTSLATEDQAEVCPQIRGTFFDLAVTGTTQGPVQDSELINISTRARVGTGDDVMIGGFVVGGTTPKTVLIRARGPSMGGAPFFVPGVLADPFVQLFSGSTLIAQNNDWQVTDPLCGPPATACGGVTQIIATGFDPCQPNPGQTTSPPGCAQESAIHITLPPGAYTAIVSGVGGTTGVGLLEVFEAAATDASKFANISTRARVGTGDDVMIGGFVIGGTTPKTVLIRARGPSMGGAPFFVPGTLADPFLQLFSGSTLIAQNNDWQVTDPLCGPPATACGGVTQITATGLDPCQPNPGQTTAPPGCAQESAIHITLPPGAYTAIVSGVGGTTGVGLMEVFEVN